MTSRNTTTSPPNKSFNSGRWTLEENLMFERGLRLFGRGRWKQISAFMKTRSRDQCKSHFQKLEAIVLKKHQQQQRQREALAVATVSAGGSSLSPGKGFLSSGRRSSLPDAAAPRKESCWWSAWIPATKFRTCNVLDSRPTANPASVSGAKKFPPVSKAKAETTSSFSSRRNGHARKAASEPAPGVTTRNQSKQHKILHQDAESESSSVANKTKPTLAKTIMLSSSSPASSTSAASKQFHSQTRPENPLSPAGQDEQNRQRRINDNLPRKRTADECRSATRSSLSASEQPRCVWTEQQQEEQPPQRRRLPWHLPESSINLHGCARRRPSLLPPACGHAGMRVRRSSRSFLRYDHCRNRSMGVPPPPPPPLWPNQVPIWRETHINHNHDDHHHRRHRPRDVPSNSRSCGAPHDIPTTQFKSRSVAVVTPSNLPSSSSSSLSSISSPSCSSSPSSTSSSSAPVDKASCSDDVSVKDTDKVQTKRDSLQPTFLPQQDKDSEHNHLVPDPPLQPEEVPLIQPGLASTHRNWRGATATAPSTTAAPPLKKRKVIHLAPSENAVVPRSEEVHRQHQHENIPFLPNLNDTSEKRSFPKVQPRTVALPSQEDETVASILCAMSKMGTLL